VRRSLALCLFIIFGLAAPAVAAGDDPLKTAAQLAKDSRYAEAQAIFKRSSTPATQSASARY
jgi:hypothetical protein